MKARATCKQDTHTINKEIIPATKEMFSDLPPAVSRALGEAAYTTTYPSGSVLFVEQQASRGIFIVRRGQVKLSVRSSDGKVVILRIAHAGEVLGTAAAVSARGYESTAETQGHSEIGFIRQNDFQSLMRVHRELPLWVVQHLSGDYEATCRRIRYLLLSESATARLAYLLVEWLVRNEESQNSGRMKFALTHKEISEIIGTSRETVSRALGDLKRRHLIHQNGATMTIVNRDALKLLMAA